MKHLLNNLSEEEKNNIRKQHSGGMKVVTENFNKLLNNKLGTVKPLISEETSSSITASLNEWGKKIGQEMKGTQVTAHKIDFDDKPIDKLNSYWIDNVVSVNTVDNVESLYDLTSVSVSTNGHRLSDDLKGSTKIQIDFRFNMSKGRVDGISRVYLFDNNKVDKVENLQTKPFEESLIPNIGKIQVLNPCFAGFQYVGKGMGASSIEGVRFDVEKFAKNNYPTKNSELELLKDRGNWNSGSGYIIPSDIEFGGKLQPLTWACSNGKLTINK
jgi:hypothetical protein